MVAPQLHYDGAQSAFLADCASLFDLDPQRTPENVAARLYAEQKSALKEARKAWVEQFGVTLAVPQRLWPRLANGQHAVWRPKASELSAAQLEEEVCPAYANAWALSANGTDVDVLRDLG